MGAAKNSAGNAKLESAKEFGCDIRDIEICERGADEISYVNNQGYPTEPKETYMGSAETAYYYCTNCSDTWEVNEQQSQAQAWSLAKEHLGENI